MDREKISIEAIQAAIQSCLGPELKDVKERLTQVEARLNRLEQRVGRLESWMDVRFEDQHREIFAHLGAVRAEIRRVETVTEFRQRLAFLEAKFAQQG
jgi:uncharacterized protein YPO0396